MIRRKLGSASLAPLAETRRQLRLPRELHGYLYLGDVNGTLSGCRGNNFDWLDEEEEEEKEADDEEREGGNEKANVMEERRNILEE